MKSTGAWSSYQLHRLHQIRGYQDSSTSNGHQVICPIDRVMLRRNWINWMNFPASHHRIFLFVFNLPLTSHSYFSENSFLMSSFACDYHRVLCSVFIQSKLLHCESVTADVLVLGDHGNLLWTCHWLWRKSQGNFVKMKYSICYDFCLRK